MKKLPDMELMDDDERFEQLILKVDDLVEELNWMRIAHHNLHKEVLMMKGVDPDVVPHPVKDLFTGIPKQKPKRTRLDEIKWMSVDAKATACPRWDQHIDLLVNLAELYYAWENADISDEEWETQRLPIFRALREVVE